MDTKSIDKETNKALAEYSAAATIDKYDGCTLGELLRVDIEDILEKIKTLYYQVKREYMSIGSEKEISKFASILRDATVLLADRHSITQEQLYLYTRHLDVGGES